MTKPWRREILLLTCILVSSSLGEEAEGGVSVVEVQPPGTSFSIELDQKRGDKPQPQSSRALHADTSSIIRNGNTSIVQEPDTKSKQWERTVTHEPYRCNIYLAPSGIPNAGFGLYTARDVRKGEKLLPYSNAPSIAVCNGAVNGLEYTDWNHPDYFWSGKGTAEYECDEITMSVVDFGAMSNFHTYLTNVHPSNVPYDDTILDRFTDPGAGAFSYHGGFTFEATEDIKAGGEIFADYGETWLDSREGTFADFVPRANDFDEGARVFSEIQKESRVHAVEMNDAIMKTMKNVVSLLEQRVGATLPKNRDEFEFIAKKHSKKYPTGRLLAENTIERRSIDWIKDNGICLDSVRPGLSTIPQAGRGAFSQGFIAKGSIVSPVPLLNIIDREKLNMHDLGYDEETGELEYKDDDSEVIGKQLLLNYCFGHIDSKLLLCPQSNMILMNHCSDRRKSEGQCSDKGPNAKIQWASGWDPDTEAWLAMEMDDIIENTCNGRRGLSFEVIATRDIYPGEEVTIDYGKNWEDAWHKHLNDWEAPGSEENAYIPLKTMIDDKRMRIRTVEELEEDPYPGNVQQVCFYPHKHDDIDDEYEETTESAENYPKPTNGIEIEKEIFPCEIIERPSGCEVGRNDTYKVRIPSINLILTEFPLESISFRMTQESTDAYLPNAFRHFIEIDDDIFPKQWKNKG